MVSGPTLLPAGIYPTELGTNLLNVWVYDGFFGTITTIISYSFYLVGGFNLPFWKIWVRQLGLWNPMVNHPIIITIVFFFMEFINQLMKLLLPSGVIVAVATPGNSTRHSLREDSPMTFPAIKNLHLIRGFSSLPFLINRGYIWRFLDNNCSYMLFIWLMMVHDG